jgi:hypothetical protein
MEWWYSWHRFGLQVNSTAGSRSESGTDCLSVKQQTLTAAI